LRRFSRTEISPDRLNLKNPLLHLLEDRSRLAEIVADPARKLPAPLNERFVVLTEDSAHELRVSDFGRTMMLRSSGWRRGARGLRVDDLPDWHYGQWVADAYRKAARSGRPMLEEISAVIEWPEHGKLSHAYWRLIVPQNAPDQPTRLLGVTLDSGVGAHELA
jgi:hypothetical protein